MNIKNTETEKNLIKAVTGECLANNRYSFYAKVARKEGYIQIANIFEETAENERQHAKRFYSYLDYNPVEITNTYTAGIASTKENLKMAFELEGEENKNLPLRRDFYFTKTYFRPFAAKPQCVFLWEGVWKAGRISS